MLIVCRHDQKSIHHAPVQAIFAHEEFIQLWEHEHAPLAHKVPYLLRYVLSPVHSQFERSDVGPMALRWIVSLSFGMKVTRRWLWPLKPLR
jgi:hypothetical protein